MVVTTAWILQILARTMASYVPFAIKDGLCTKQGQLYSMHLSNLTHWAVQMLDSSSAGLSGLLSGNRFDFGNQDQCAELAVPELHIYGRYLVFSLKFSLNSTQFKEQSTTAYEKPKPDSSVWQEFSRKDNRTNEIHWAVCVPASCSSADVQHSLASTLMPILESNGIISNLTVPDRYSYSKMDQPINVPPGYYLFLLITVGLFLAVILATTYHLWQGDANSEKRKKWYYRFSMVTSMSTLLRTEPTDEFRAISGMKVLSMFLVIMGHRVMISSFLPYINQREMQQKVGTITGTYLANSALVVNTFFVVTGFLTNCKILKNIDRNKSINVFKWIIRRWIRFLPAYAFILGFVVYILPQLDVGPIGRYVISTAPCRRYWWTHLVFINNYLYPENQCLIPSWYMACDLQFYAMCSILGYIMFRSRKVGLSLLASLTIISVVIPGVVTFKEQFVGVNLIEQKNFEEYLSNKAFVETYFYAHLRASPFLIGMGAAYVYYLMKRYNVKISKLQIWLIFVPMAMLMTASVSSFCGLHITGQDYKLWTNILYVTVYRVGWAIPVAFLIIAEAYTAFALCRKTVGLRLFQYLNGLTYSALLVQSPLQLYLTGLGRSSMYYSSFLVFWMSLGDIFLSYLLALALYLFVEAPLTLLQDIPDTISNWLIAICSRNVDKMLKK